MKNLKSKDKILVFGKNGQVAFELAQILPLIGDVIIVDSQQCPLQDEGGIKKTIEQYRTQIIVNAAAYTAVDKVESEEELFY